MAQEASTPDEIDGPGGDEGVPLKSLGDVQREMAKVYRAMRKKRIAISDGNGLTQTLQYLAKVMQDRAESKWMQRAEVLWKERQERAAPDAKPQENH